MEHFIETVRKYPCLWNTTAIEYRDQELKDAAWAEVMKETDLSSGESPRPARAPARSPRAAHYCCDIEAHTTSKPFPNAPSAEYRLPSGAAATPRRAPALYFLYLYNERGEAEVEEAARQLPRRAQETERDAGEGPRQPRQEELPLEVHGADAVPAAVHEQPQKAGGLAQLPRASAGRRERSRRALVDRLGVGRRVGAQTQELLAADRHRPQVGLPVQGAVRQARLRRARPRGRGRRRRRAGHARAPRPARHLLQQHVPVHQAVPLPDADQDKEELVQRCDRGRGGAAGGAGQLRQPVGGGGGLVVVQRAQRRRAQAVLSPPRAPAPPRAAVHAVRAVRRRGRRALRLNSSHASSSIERLIDVDRFS